MKGILNRLANNEQANSLADRLRKRRFALFRSLITDLPRPLKIIDVGGTENYWEKMGFLTEKDVSISLVNLSARKVKHKNLQSYAGDARNLRQFDDQSFHIAFSNSVIEHVGNFHDQQSMVREMRRVAPRIYLQTPNRYFPLEPHFLFPFFQFLPLRARVWLLMNFQLGWYPRFTDTREAIKTAKSIRLLSHNELRILFPMARIYREKFLGFTKSFVVVEGF
jgi:hypothetical protein